MELNLGHKGAFGDSWRLKSVRNLFATLVDENPNASEDKLVQLCMERIREDDDYAEAAAQYIVRNALESQERQRRNRISTAEMQVRAAEMTKKVGEVKKQIEHVMLLNLEMPNGKRLRYCTGAEVARFGKAYERIAKKVGSTKMVGTVLGEAELRKLMA